MQTETLKLTYADYALLPDDGRRHEIIDGDEAMSPAPSTWHQRFVVRLVAQLQRYVEETGAGEVFVAPTDVILSPTDIVQPDVFFIANDRRDLISKRGIEGAPDLAVEVLSEGNRRLDEVRKRRLYAAFGVQEYWIADPELDMAKVLRLQEVSYVQVAELHAEAGDALSTPLLPGLRLSLADLFG